MSVRVVHKMDSETPPTVRVTREYNDKCMEDIDGGAGYDLTIMDHEAQQKMPIRGRYSLVGKICGFGDGYGLYSCNTNAECWLKDRITSSEIVFDSESDMFCCRSDDLSLIMLCIEHMDACIDGYEKLPTRFEL